MIVEPTSDAPASKIFVRSHESLTNQIVMTDVTQQPSEASTPDCIIVSPEIVTPEQTGKIFIRDIETLTTPSSDSYFQPTYQPPPIYLPQLDAQQRCKISIKNMETLIEPNLMQPPNLMSSQPMSIFGPSQNLIIHIQPPPPSSDDNLLRYRDTSVTPDTLPCSSNVSTCGGNDDVIMLDDHEILIPNVILNGFDETQEIAATNEVEKSTSDEIVIEVLETPERNETPNDKNVLQKLELKEDAHDQPMVSIPMEFCNTTTTSEDIKSPKKLRKLQLKSIKRMKKRKSSKKSEANIKIVYKCSHESCNENFSSENLLNYHRKCHGETETAISCPECGSDDFKTFSNLHTHLWRVHKVDIDLYSCELCNFKTPILSRLNNFHAKTHLEEKNYKCSFDGCDRKFKNSKQLANHVQQHKKKKIDKVEKIEDAVKKLRCHECNKSFSSESGLYIHSKEHKSEDKTFICTDCDYSTNDHNSFRRHKSQHSLVHRYKCPSCDYSSIQSNTYRKHLERQHPELAESLLFKCNICKFTTISRVKYDGHLAKHCGMDGVGSKKKRIRVKKMIKVKSSELLMHDQAAVDYD